MYTSAHLALESDSGHRHGHAVDDTLVKRRHFPKHSFRDIDPIGRTACTSVDDGNNSMLATVMVGDLHLVTAVERGIGRHGSNHGIVVWVLVTWTSRILELLTAVKCHFARFDGCFA